MDFVINRLRLRYAAAIACGLTASLTVYVICRSLGIHLIGFLPKGEGEPQQLFDAAVAWWTMAGAGVVVAWGVQIYLVTAAREREFIDRLMQRSLVVTAFVVAATGGIISGGGMGTDADVVAGLIVLGVGFFCASCGARLA